MYDAPSTPAQVQILRQTTRFAPLLLFILFLVRYLTTLTDVHTFDALSYVLDVDRKPWRELFHPHHLAYGPLGAVALRLAQMLGYAGSAARPLQYVNAAAGALGVALFFCVVRRAVGRSDLATLAALLLGSSYAYWYYAVEIEVYTVAVLFLVICLQILVELARQPTAGRWMALGVAQGLAVLFHQTNMLLCLPALVMWATGRPRSLSAVSSFALYLITLGLSVALPYSIVAYISGFGTWQEFAGWTTSYARTGWWGGPITTQKWIELAQGLADTLAQPGGAWLGLLLLALGLWYGYRTTWRHTRLAACLLGWLIVYGGFFFWWEPDNIEFWIASLPPALLLLALALSATKRWQRGIWVGLTAAVLMFFFNSGAIATRGAAANDLQRSISRALADHSEPVDLLLVPDGLQELYLPYYEDRPNYLSLNQALFDQQGDGEKRWLAACGEIQRRIEATLASGGAVLIAPEVQVPPDELLDRHSLDRAAVAACFEPYRSELTDAGFRQPLPAYGRIPNAQELAEGNGWSFHTTSWGWQAVNSSGSGFNDGWRLTPAMDPGLISPLMRIDTTQVSAFEVRLANGTAARDAQLFFGDLAGQMDDSRSVRWTLVASEDATTYLVELRGQPGWDGVVTRLRFDPIGVGDGGELRIEWVRLLK